jgi:allantoin racemase
MRIDVIQANRPARGRLSPEREAAIRRTSLTGATVVIHVPDGGPRSIASAYEDALAAPHVIRLARLAEAEGADAVVVNCTADTGIEAAREALAIPVVGVSEAAFHLAAQLCHRFSVLTFAARIAPRFRAMAGRFGLADRLASVRSVELPLETLPDPDRLADDLASMAAQAIREDGAEAIILGCTDFELAAGEAGARLAAAGMEVPLLKPYDIGLHLAESLVSMRLTQSKRAFPTPRHLDPDDESRS